MGLQNILNILFVAILFILYKSHVAQGRQIRALFHITDTLRDLLTNFIKEKDNEEETL